MASEEISGEKTKAASQKIKERDFWLERLAGEWQKTAFYYDHPEGKGPKTIESLSFSLTGESFSDLMRLSNKSDQRLFMILAAQLVLLLYKYTGHTDIIVGAPIYRQDMEGSFINTVLALRSSFEPGITFKQLLLQFRNTLVEAVEHQNYPIEALLHKLNLPAFRDQEHDFPLFDIAVLLENIHDRGYIKHINTNISFYIRRCEGEVQGVIEYNSLLYNVSTIERIITHYKHLVRHMMTSLDTPLTDLEIFSEEEKKQILVDFNDTGGEYPAGKTIHQWFEEQSARTPDNIAVSGHGCLEAWRHEEIHLTYRELNKKSNQLAHVLREKGVRPDTIAALMVKRSIEMIFGLLAILKAGGAYLPIDPGYPEDRINYMLTDSNTEILVSEVNKLSEVSGRTEVIDLPSLIAAKEDAEPTHFTYLTHPTHLCYIIYTSGSTGRPKGVMLEHKNVVNLLYFDFHYTNLDFSKVLQFHTIGFDASFHEIFSAFLSGGQLVLIREETRTDIPELFRIVETNRIPTLFLPMSFLRIIFSDEDNIRLFPRCVRHIQTAGEQVVINHLFRCFLQENRVYLHNHYGPAETHVVTALTLDPTSPIPELPLIGKSILNTAIYILDRDKQLLPVGVPGELWIGGGQVGRGYLNNPELTAERFLVSYRSYRTNRTYIPSKKIYKTGDLARWTAGGDIEFLGRIDTQVKIRGFRIEPGEIESRLRDIDEIKEAVVIDRTDEKGEKYLCAYVVSDTEINPAELRDTLANTLPDYMVPSYFVQVEAIPLSPNGKVKKDALLPIESVRLKKTYAPPRDEVEKKLCRLWSEVLGMEEENIGIDDNFFQLGGHSLRATILITKIYKTFNVRILLGELFDQPFIRGLAWLIEGADVKIFAAIEPVEKREYYPMSSAQKRMYIINQLERDSISYNMPAPLVVEGDVDRERFTAVFRQLIRCQEGLRTGFETLDGQPVQRVHDEISFEIEDCSTDVFSVPDDIIKNFIRPFDLSRAPLMRVGLAKLEKEKYLLLVDFHHIIGDGVSMGVLIREFTRVYEGKEIAPLRIQYRDYALWQENLAESGELKRQEEYWLKQLDEDLPSLNLPLDYPRPAMMSFEGRWLNFEISAELTGKLKKLAEHHEATLYMVLLAAYNVLLHKYTGQETIVVGSVIAGRSYTDLENIIGVFLNTQAMKNNLSDNLTFERFLEQVRENALRAYENQDYQFEELVEKLKLKRDYSRNPLFDTMLNFINMEIPEVKLGGLKLTLYKTESEAVKLDIKINAREQDGALHCSLDYSSRLFKAETMESLIENFIDILHKTVEEPGIKISDIQLISEAEKNEMIKDFTAEIEYEF